MKLFKEMKDGLTRREFVKNAANGTAAFAIGAGSMAIPASAQSAKSTQISGKTIREAARDTKVCRTADVVVVGGGPGGIGAALAGHLGLRPGDPIALTHPSGSSRTRDAVVFCPGGYAAPEKRWCQAVSIHKSQISWLSLLAC